MLKCVSFNPRSFTRLFINPTKLLILPEMCSATARHTSLADSSMIAFKHCSTDNFSPGSEKIVELPVSMPYAAVDETVTVSFMEVFSAKSMDVRILVILAG